MTAANVFGGGVAVITGAGAGIGAGLAREAGRIGMTVIVSDISPARAANVAGDINKAGGVAHAVPTDVRDHEAVEALAAFVEKKFGHVRLLINNAGIEMLGLIWELTPAQWQSAMDINVNGIFYGARAFIPRMIDAVRRGRRAAIANLSSVGGVGTSPMMAPYIVSKHAVLAFTECLSLDMELAGIPIDISVITPGMVRTSIFEDAPISGGETTALAERYRVAMRDYMASEGMEVGAAARFIFDQLAARSFWISTQPEMTESFATARAEYLRTRARPALNSRMRELLGSE